MILKKAQKSQFFGNFSKKIVVKNNFKILQSSHTEFVTLSSVGNWKKYQVDLLT